MFAPEFTEQIADKVVEVVNQKLDKTEYGITVSRLEACQIIGTSEPTFNNIRKRDDFQFVLIEGAPGRFSTSNLIKWINGERTVKK